MLPYFIPNYVILIFTSKYIRTLQWDTQFVSMPVPIATAKDMKLITFKLFYSTFRYCTKYPIDVKKTQAKLKEEAGGKLGQCHERRPTRRRQLL